MAQRYNGSSSATRKYKGSELYLLPPRLFLNDPVDTMDQCCLNFSFASMVSPLKKSLAIDLYNEIYFPSNSNHITTPTVDQASCRVDELSMQEFQDQSNMPSATVLFDNSKTSIPESEINTCFSLDDIPNVVDLSDKLFLYSLHQREHYAAVGI